MVLKTSFYVFIKKMKYNTNLIKSMRYDHNFTPATQ